MSSVIGWRGTQASHLCPATPISLLRLWQPTLARLKNEFCTRTSALSLPASDVRITSDKHATSVSGDFLATSAATWLNLAGFQTKRHSNSSICSLSSLLLLLFWRHVKCVERETCKQHLNRLFTCLSTRWSLPQVSAAVYTRASGLIDVAEKSLLPRHRERACRQA